MKAKSKPSIADLYRTNLKQIISRKNPLYILAGETDQSMSAASWWRGWFGLRQRLRSAVNNGIDNRGFLGFMFHRIFEEISAFLGEKIYHKMIYLSSNINGLCYFAGTTTYGIIVTSSKGLRSLSSSCAVDAPRLAAG